MVSSVHSNVQLLYSIIVLGLSVSDVAAAVVFLSSYKFSSVSEDDGKQVVSYVHYNVQLLHPITKAIVL